MINIRSNWPLVRLIIINFLIVGCVRCNINWNGTNSALACDFRQNNLASTRIVLSLCAAQCAQTSNCTHYTWTTYNDGTCWMKYGTVSKDDAVYTNDTTMTCGILDSVIQSGIEWNENSWTVGCYFYGNDMTNVQIASDLCREQCAQTLGCSHFVWTKYMNGTCWMKSGMISKNDAVHSGDPDMVCGIVNTTSIDAVVRTPTQYWNCCESGCDVSTGVRWKCGCIWMWISMSVLFLFKYLKD